MICYLHRIARRSIFFALLLFASAVNASNLNYPGGIVQIELEKKTKQPPMARFGTKDLLVLDRGNRWLVVFGLELTMIPGDYLLYVKPASKDLDSYIKKFRVLPRSDVFKIHSIDIENPLLPDSLSTLDFENSSPPKFPFNYPIAGQWENRFGQAILRNQSEKETRFSQSNSDEIDFRTYLSLTTTAIETVQSPQNGIVSMIMPYQENSFSVYIDHGRSLYSILHGVADLNVEVGNGIVKGAVLGKLPSDTGIEKPATIIWQSIFNDILIDPENLTKLR